MLSPRFWWTCED